MPQNSPRSSRFDPSTKAILDSYGISEDVAAYAGIFGVENAQRDLEPLAATGATLAVLQHRKQAAQVLNVHGQGVPYCPRVKNFHWKDIFDNPAIPIVITDNHLKALKLCSEGTPAIAVIGVSKTQLTAWLRQRGADVIHREGALH